ncbi:MAG: spore coat protein CotJB [Clostridium argentinense]|uniref:Spore coat protein CotJB n=1 Tax=Clostridium faecium TaxID=2762223 RepID=A0ABR8YVK1_9CLOT|nr:MULTISPECIES: spore coat protein CotJB [Clostridium]MBD8048302.1 spore coat protein CotJB [Clostridium faecium]MBS5823035.1 spore coat protein CotJB [Clostridium argentinense]MDU1349193.1 spore coat protein CotJB [Clostridium argentinense]
MNANELLSAIREYQFYAIELNLYLDNFPNDERAKKDFKITSHKLSCLISEYEEKYGPLTNFGSAFVENPSAWVKEPWPWESKQNRGEEE